MRRVKKVALAFLFQIFVSLFCLEAQDASAFFIPRPWLSNHGTYDYVWLPSSLIHRLDPKVLPDIFMTGPEVSNDSSVYEGLTTPLNLALEEEVQVWLAFRDHAPTWSKEKWHDNITKRFKRNGFDPTLKLGDFIVLRRTVRRDVLIHELSSVPLVYISKNQPTLNQLETAERRSRADLFYMRLPREIVDGILDGHLVLPKGIILQRVPENLSNAASPTSLAIGSVGSHYEFIHAASKSLGIGENLMMPTVHPVRDLAPLKLIERPPAVEEVHKKLRLYLDQPGAVQFRTLSGTEFDYVISKTSVYPSGSVESFRVFSPFLQTSFPSTRCSKSVQILGRYKLNISFD